jgi:hypothetical protein
MMNPLRLSPVPTPVLRSVVFATGVVGLLATGSEGLQTTGAAPPTEICAPSDSATPQLASASSISDDDLGQTRLQTHSPTDVAMAEPSLAGASADVSITLNLPQPDVETASTQAPQVPPAKSAPQAEPAPPTEQAPPAETRPPNEPAPVQVANANPSDIDLSDVQPGNANKAVTTIDIPDECPAVDICIDRYLWALYQRTPKEDSIKQVEWRSVTVERKVKVKGKGKEKSKTKTVTVTVRKAFTKLVDQDFGWKDPKAAERVGMPMMNYVIGGMDRSFKLKLFRMLRAAEVAGLSPGITSAFRDDYRQSIASGLKAASNRSYHGGSLRGGYGYGLAADIVSIQGATRNERWTSSDKLWKWVDANGKQFGIARPYLGRDPPHVAPVDGQEYAKHNRGTKLAAANAKKVDAKKASTKQASNAKQIKEKKPNLVIMRDASRLAKRDNSRPAKRPKTATASKLKDG